MIIRDLLCRAQRGVGGVVLLEGEPGSGTSLLLRDATDAAAQMGFSLAMGAADQWIPFFPLHAVMREPFVGLSPDDPDPTAWQVSQMRSCLEQRAAVTPVLMCLDDLQWARPVTLAVLRALSRDLKRIPVACLLARSTTPQSAADHMYDVMEQEGAARVTLAPLDQAAVTAMLADAFGAPPAQALADLAAGAAGNASLLAELIRGLHDDRAVLVTEGRSELVSDRMPQRILRFAERRLDALSRKARRLLMTAAVVGPTFQLEDAADMLGETPATLLPAVQETMDAAIVTCAHDAFAFRHQLLHRAVEEMIPQAARQALHRQYGEILLAQGKSADQAASHLLRAADPGNPASLAGLDHAAAQTLGYAPQTAASLAARALELTSPGHPAALARTVAAAEALTAAGRVSQAAQVADDALTKPLPPESEARLRCAMSSVLCARGQARSAADQAQLVLAWAELPGDLRDQALTAYLQAVAGLRDERAGVTAEMVLAAGVHAGHVKAAALVTRAVIAWNEGQISDALDMLRDAARHDGGVSSDARRVQPLLALAAALIDVRQLDEAEDILRAAENPSLHGIPASAALSLLRSRIHLAAGRPAEAATAGQSALAVARSLGARGYAATAHSVLSLIELRRGDVEAAARHVARREFAGPHFADSYARPETALAEAQVTEACEGPAAVLGRLRELCEGFEAWPGLVLGDPASAAWLARTALAGGDGELASAVARNVQAIADAHPGFPALAVAAAHSGGLVGRDPSRLALAAARHPDPWARASATEDLAALHGRQGDQAQEIRYLKEALRGYRGVGADRDQARIRWRLRQLGIRSRHWVAGLARPVSGWESLTDGERAVAGLVAEGLTNIQVAHRLYISSHTVAYHLRQAYRKLSIASRYELTRIVLEQDADSASPAGLARV